MYPTVDFSPRRGEYGVSREGGAGSHQTQLSYGFATVQQAGPDPPSPSQARAVPPRGDKSWAEMQALGGAYGVRGAQNAWVTQPRAPMRRLFPCEYCFRRDTTDHPVETSHL